MAVYDATNAEARKYYWELMDKGLFRLGIDAWWLDTTEPETEGQEDNIQLGHKVAMGSGNRYVNLYSLLTTGAVYDGQRSASNDKRVFILSRSSFAGAQRNAVTAWSGDIGSDWFSFRRQIPAGLNFSLSGLPYWTTDIGGFLFGAALTTRPTGSCSRGGSSTAPSAPSSACTARAIRTKTSCGRMARTLRRSSWPSTGFATGCFPTSIPSPG